MIKYRKPIEECVYLLERYYVKEVSKKVASSIEYDKIILRSKEELTSKIIKVIENKTNLRYYSPFIYEVISYLYKYRLKLGILEFLPPPRGQTTLLTAQSS